jgi:hypothetical protein
MNRKRCAIYTRKSTEEGLDQAFNSLDAQREACEAFIVSQRHDGWILVKKTMMTVVIRAVQSIALPFRCCSTTSSRE